MANFVSYSNANTLMTSIAEKIKALKGAYIIRGNSTFANLPSVLTESMNGYVYNVTDDFTTDARFAEGTGIKQPAGTNVVVAAVSSHDSYVEVTPTGDEDPSAEGWYEQDLTTSTTTYKLSEDTAVVPSKKYYEKSTVSDMKFDIIGTFVDVDELNDRIDKTQLSIAPAFDDTTDYTVGDTVIYGDELYICTTDHDAGDWDSNDFTKTTVREIISAAEPDSLTEEQITALLELLD